MKLLFGKTSFQHEFDLASWVQDPANPASRMDPGDHFAPLVFG